MSFDYDPELPAGYQEADLEMAELVEQSRSAAADRRRGVCRHSWQLAGGRSFYSADEIAEDRRRGSFPDRPTDPAVTDQASIPAGHALCLDCGQLVADRCPR